MPLKIGLIGATTIAERTMVCPSATRPDTVIQAVAASDERRAARFAARHGINTVHQRYEQLVEDDEIDLVYISLHNSAHHPWAARAARAGKHVVVEKPLCLGPAELAEIESSAYGVHVVEAVATAGHPWQSAVREAVADARYGRLRSMHSRFRFSPGTAQGYRLRPELGGGIFRDAASYWLEAVQATVGLSGAVGAGWAEFDRPGGVDTAFRARLSWPDGRESTLECSFGTGHVGEHEFRFERAELRIRRVLLPMAGALPLNLSITTSDGERTIVPCPAVSYYDVQFERIRRLVTGQAETWGGDFPAARERVMMMSAIYDEAKRVRARGIG